MSLTYSKQAIMPIILPCLPLKTVLWLLLDITAHRVDWLASSGESMKEMTIIKEIFYFWSSFEIADDPAKKSFSSKS